MNLVKLTNRVGGPAYVNMDMVQLFEPDSKGGTSLHFGEEDVANVKETPSEIIAKLVRKKFNGTPGHGIE